MEPVMNEGQELLQPAEAPAPDALDAMVAGALAVYDPLQAEIEALRTQVQNTVFDFTKSKEARAAKSVRAAINAIPGKLDEAYKAWNKPRLETAAKMREKVVELKALIPDIVKPLDEQIKADDERREKERLAAEQAEAARVSAIRAKIAGIAALPVKLAAQSSEVLAQTIGYVQAQEIKEESFAEFTAETKQTVVDVLAALEILRAGAVRREAQEAELVELRAQQAVRDAEAAAQRERDRIAAEAQAKKDNEAAELARQAKILADAEEASRLAAHNKAIEDSARAMAAQRDAFEAERAIAVFIEGMRSKITDAAMNPTSEFIDTCLSAVAEADFGDLDRADVTRQLPAAQADVLDKLAALKRAALKREQADADATAQAAAAIETAKAPPPTPAAAPPAPSVEDQLLEVNAAAKDDANAVALHAVAETVAQVVARAPADIVRPDDATILHMVATTFGVSEAIALDWFESMDLFALKAHVEPAHV